MKKSEWFGVVCSAVFVISIILATVLGYKTISNGIQLFSLSSFLAVVSGYVFLLWPTGSITGRMLTATNVKSKKEGLEHGGSLIGYLERFLIFTFILANQYEAVALLIAAKSILRYPDLQENSEYILIGTLFSFSFAVVVGILVRQFF